MEFPLFLNQGKFTTRTAYIHDPNFAFSFNEESAVVQLPYAVQEVGSSTTTTTYLNYNIPDVQSYDWSTPPWEAYQNFGFWNQYLNPSPQNQVGAEITGINRERQAQNDRDTFISGVLLGIVGAAIIAFMQEALHILGDERRHEKVNSAESAT